MARTHILHTRATDTDAGQHGFRFTFNEIPLGAACLMAPQTAFRKSHLTSVHKDVAALAALTICESFMLALNDRKFLLERDIVGILKDAAAAYKHVPKGDISP